MPAPNLVLLTATVVTPPDARNLARRDAALRLHDYLQAFDFYLAQLSAGHMDALVLCENSGFDLAPFAQRARQAGLQQRVERSATTAWTTRRTTAAATASSSWWTKRCGIRR